MRTEENLVKPDTPAIPSVRSRLHGLAALRHRDQENGEFQPHQKPLGLSHLVHVSWLRLWTGLQLVFP